MITMLIIFIFLSVIEDGLSKEKITKDQEYTREVETKRKKQTQNWQSEKEQKLKGKEKQILKISGGNLGKRKQKTETKTN